MLPSTFNLPLRPLLYELNTRCWLRDLSERHSSPINLASVPESEFLCWQQFGFTHLWLMGVWTTGPLARTQVLRSPQQRAAYSDIIPDWTESDVAGSPYAIADYRVPDALGGDAALAVFRRKLRAYGLKLILDFVPNHLGLDHPWLNELPDLFVQTNTPPRLPVTRAELRQERPETFSRPTRHGLRTFAHGKDPNFPPWTDTVQLDYRLPQTHVKMVEVLQSIADRCDGVRCDMAMLILPEVFNQTWSRLSDSARSETSGPPASSPDRSPLPAPLTALPDFWPAAISAVKSRHSNFLFLAEAYWGLEPRLLQLGFDYTYDKELYDRLIARDSAGVQRHLFQVRSTLSQGCHFLENHDERRIASVLTPAEHRAAVLLILGLPGISLLHDGQLTGARRRLPVQIARRPSEPIVPEIAQFYDQLLSTLPLTSVGYGKSDLLMPRQAWSENPTAENFILVQWQKNPGSFDLVAVNLAAHPGQCYVPFTVSDLSTHNWHIRDLLSGTCFIRSGVDLSSRGLYLDLPVSTGCLFHFTPSS